MEMLWNGIDSNEPKENKNRSRRSNKIKSNKVIRCWLFNDFRLISHTRWISVLRLASK